MCARRTYTLYLYTRSESAWLHFIIIFDVDFYVTFDFMKRILQFTILSCMFLAYSVNGLGQQTITVITGKVVEQSTREPMEFVNVSLFRTNDSTTVDGVFTDKNGGYKFSGVKEGKYYLKISFLGFEPLKTASFSVKAGKSVDLGTSGISPSSQLLNEVEVSSEKSFMETTIDKQVYNVDKNIVSISGSASQVLENIPSLNVGIDGEVTLRGSSNVTFLINGKPSPMMRLNSAEALQQIPANTIERIEVITNPSAKYKPDGTSGIINIVLKKETRQGLNGSITANAGFDNRYNSTLTLNYKPGKMNIFGSYGFRKDHRVRTSTDFRTMKDSSGYLISQYDRIGTTINRPLSHTVNLGADYDIDKKNAVGISGSYFYMDFLRDEKTTAILSDSANEVTSDYDRNRLDNEYEYDKEISARYNHDFNKEDHSLQAEINFNDHYEQEDNRFTQIYRTPADDNSYDNTLIRQWEQSGEATIEYAYPFNEDAELEAGYSEEWLKQTFDFYGEYLDSASTVWIKDLQKSNRFIFTQNVQALYTTYSRSMGDFGFLLGLRGEYANINSDLTTLDSVVNNDYFKLYPTIHLSYELSDEQEIKLSYSHRVNRPEGDELNPFPEYNDPRNISAGNPLLKPEQIHSIEFGYMYKKESITVVPTIFYRYKYDAFTEVAISVNDSTLLETVENLSNEQSAGMEMIFTWQLKKALRLSITGDLFYDQIDASNLGYSENKSAISGDLKLGANLNLTKSTVLQLNANYRSEELSPQGRELPMYYLNLGLRQDLLKNKASLLLAVSDIFNTMRWQSEIDTPVLYEKATRKRQSQIIYLGFTYRFGKASKKGPEDIKFDDRMN